jgi:hypothetical protein
MRLQPTATFAVLSGLLVGLGTASAARAEEKPAAWTDTLKFSGYVEAGITGNPDSPADGINFGHLFTDRANTPMMNQFSLIAERPLDPKATGYDFGFRLQGMFGTDARYTHFLGEFDRSLHGQYQFDVVEANVQAHLPLLTEGGIDLKLGQYVTPLGAETIDPRTNYLYSHSYIFNFGIPLKHTGLLSVAHLSSLLDLYAGVDSGVNTSLGNPGDNNDSAAFLGGAGLNLLDGKLTILALTHFGPENPRTTGSLSHDNRYLNDVVVTWKVSDSLTSITELNYAHDDGFHASAGGVAQYGVYALSDQWSVVGRAEIFRDDNGFFVAKFPGNLDFVNAERGLPNSAVGGGKTTYGAITLGLNFKPPVPAAFEGAVIRPEVRYDWSLNGTKPFNAGTSDHQFTIAADVILPF